MLNCCAARRPARERPGHGRWRKRPSMTPRCASPPASSTRARSRRTAGSGAGGSTSPVSSATAPRRRRSHRWRSAGSAAQWRWRRGSFFTCALLVDSTVRCWGDNGAGQLGGTTNTPFTPVVVSGLSNVVALGAGAQHACALLAGGTVRCWGANGAGQLGDGSTTSQSTPVAASGCVQRGGAGGRVEPHVRAAREWHGPLLGLEQFGSARGWHRRPPACSGHRQRSRWRRRHHRAESPHVRGCWPAGIVRCWGSNASGELGDGSTTRRLTPVAVSGPHQCGERDRRHVAHLRGDGERARGLLGARTAPASSATAPARDG